MDLDPVERVTVGAVGEPGRRTFYLQARRGAELVTVLIEKEQLELLSASILEILARVGKETGRGPSEEELDLEEPLRPLWRAGRISIGYEEARDLILLEVEELVEESKEETEEEGAGDVPEPRRVRLWAARDRMLALSRHGAAVAARGRPRCELCGNPIDPEGHACPKMNGHREQRA